uniref:Uncharacterized protein n=1 Tax=Pelusios castaneus TaxID=367368 RepID=A0A8C8S1M6_9SAUR
MLVSDWRRVGGAEGAEWLFPAVKGDSRYQSIWAIGVAEVAGPGPRCRGYSDSAATRRAVCEDCRLYFRDACPQHGVPTFIADSPVPARAPSRALLSLPQGLLVKERPQGGLGVWCALPALPRGCIFGPYQGEVVLEHQECTLFSWAVWENGSYFYIDASDDSKSSWMRYVACASTEEEHNLTVFQYRGHIYYRACQSIGAGAELLVWIGEEYARTLGLKLGEHFKYEFGEKELLLKMFQDLRVKPAEPAPAPPSCPPYLCGNLASSRLRSHKPGYLAMGMDRAPRGHPDPAFPLLEGTQNLVGLGRAQSRYWTFFGFQGDAYGRILDKTKIICKLCGVRLSYSGNTTNLRQHLIYKHRREYNQLVGVQAGAPDIPKGAPSPATLGRTTRAMADFLVWDLMPLEVVEGEGFAQMLRTLEPGSKPPAAGFLAHTLLRERHLQGKAKVAELVRELPHCALSLDLWCHGPGLSYLTLTLHYVDTAFDACARVLCSRPVPEELSPESLAGVLSWVAGEWGVRESGAYAVGPHGPAARQAAAALGWQALPCVGQALGGAMEAVLALPPVQSALERCRHLASWALAGPGRAEEPLLRTLLQRLLRDGAQWQGAHGLLQGLLEQAEVLGGLGPEGEPALHHQDWATLQDAADVLKPLAVAASTFTKEPFAGLSLVKPVLTSLLYKHLAPSEWDSELVKAAKGAAHRELSRRYADPEAGRVLNLACALDPRFRGLDFLSQPERCETLRLLMLEAVGLAEGPGASPCGQASSPSLPPPPPKQPLQDSGIEYLLGDLCSGQGGVGSGSVQQQAEQESASFQTSGASSLGQEPLQWWKMHHAQYPLLTRVARKLLGVPATAAPAAWLFGEAGQVMYKKRAALAPEHVDMLVFLHGNRTVL